MQWIKLLTIKSNQNWFAGLFGNYKKNLATVCSRSKVKCAELQTHALICNFGNQFQSLIIHLLSAFYSRRTKLSLLVTVAWVWRCCWAYYRNNRETATKQPLYDLQILRLTEADLIRFIIKRSPRPQLTRAVNHYSVFVIYSRPCWTPNQCKYVTSCTVLLATYYYLHSLWTQYRQFRSAAKD